MIGISITGIAEVKDYLKLKPEKAQEELIKCGLEIEGTAKRYCTDMKAVDTGRLRASISTAWWNSGRGKIRSPVAQSKPTDSVTEPKKKPYEIAKVKIGTSVEYAKHIVYGTRTMPPRDFLTPAVHYHLRDLKKRLADAVI